MDEQVKLIEHEFYVRSAIGEKNLQSRQERIQRRFDWNGNDHLERSQKSEAYENIKLTERLDKMYQYENEPPLVQVVEEEKNLDKKQADKLRKEKESKLKANRKKIMAAYKAMMTDSPEPTPLTDEKIMNKLFDDSYSYETAKEFSPEAVRENFEECIRKFDEINYIANKLKARPELANIVVEHEGEQYEGSILYDFQEFAEVCRKQLNNSLAVNGLEIVKGVPVEISYEKSREAEIKDSKISRELVNVFKKGRYMEEKSIIRNIVEDVVNSWSVGDYFSRVVGVEAMQEMHKNVETYCKKTGVKEKQLVKTLYEDYMFYFNSIMANKDALRELRDGMNNPKESKYFCDLDFDYSVHVEDMMQELDEHIKKTIQDSERIRKLLYAKINGEEISLKQRMYLAEYYGVRDEELVKEYAEKANKYKNIKSIYSSKPAYDEVFTLETNRAKINELCSKLKSDNTIDELIDMSEDLFKVSEVIEKREQIFFRTPLDILKSQKILTYAKKARAALLFRTSGLGDVAEQSLTENERLYIYQTYGYFSADNIVDYAKMLYGEADATFINAKRQFINRKEAWEKLDKSRFEVESAKKSQHYKSEQAVKETRAEYDKPDTNFYLMYFSWNSAPTSSETVKELLRNKMGHFQTIERLMKDEYSVFGETDKIALNLENLEKLPYIKDMSDDEYMDLITKLRAGTFFEKDGNIYDKEHFDAELKLKENYATSFRNMNLAGLNIIKTKMSEYIDNIFNKYGFDMPRLEIIAENPSEIISDFSYCRECYKYVDNKVMFNQESEEDELLRNKIIYYSKMIKCFDTAIEIANSDDFYMGKIELETQKIYNNEMKKIGEHIKKLHSDIV